MPDASAPALRLLKPQNGAGRNVPFVLYVAMLGICWLAGCDSAPPTDTKAGKSDPEIEDPLVVAVEKSGGDLVAAARKMTWEGVEVDQDGKIVSAIFTSTNLTDAGLALLKDCRRIRTLNLSFTPITDAGLEYLRGMQQLESIGLSETQITDEGLGNLAELKQLRRLRLFNCRGITNAGLKQLSGLKSLEFLQLSGTRCTGEIVRTLAAFPRLRSLELNGLHFEKNDLKSLAELPNLISLSLSQTNVSDEMLADLSVLKRIRRLELNGTAISDEGLKSLAKLTTIVRLTMSDTRVTEAAKSTLQQSLPNWRRQRPIPLPRLRRPQRLAAD